MPTRTELFDLSGRTALVTGGSRGLGRAMASALAGAGAHVIDSSRDLASCETTVAEIESLGGSPSTIAAHIGKWGESSVSSIK